MDIVEWCDLLLSKLVEISQTSPIVRMTGIDEDDLSKSMFPEKYASYQEFFNSNARGAVLDAAYELARLNLINVDGAVFKVTKQGYECARDMIPLWEYICKKTLDPEQQELLQVVNRLSHHPGSEFAELDWVKHETLLAELGWSSPTALHLLWSVAESLEHDSLINSSKTLGAIEIHSTYAGLVWETRRGFTIESRFIDQLVQEWETTSIDFKRELKLDTKDQKVEFIKDLLGLANTQASGRRWLIIGFDDKTRAFHSPPDPRLSQNRIEQIVADNIEPFLSVRYDVIDYRSGKIGRLEVLRESKKLPYRVAKDMNGDKRRIVQGQIFVRHGSQVEEPTDAELRAIQEEGDRARCVQ